MAGSRVRGMIRGMKRLLLFVVVSELTYWWLQHWAAHLHATLASR